MAVEEEAAPVAHRWVSEVMAAQASQPLAPALAAAAAVGEAQELLARRHQLPTEAEGSAALALLLLVVELVEQPAPTYPALALVITMRPQILC